MHTKEDLTPDFCLLIGEDERLSILTESSLKQPKHVYTFHGENCMTNILLHAPNIPSVLSSYAHTDLSLL